jgi:steroid delta-isomerase-like uncharacterized protein
VNATGDERRTSKGDTTMSVEENKALVRRFVEEFWNTGNMAAADELIADGATITLPGVGSANIETFKMFARTLRSAFPDWHSTLEEMVGEENTVAERWTGRGTHRGEFQGTAPTGRQVMVPGVVFYRIASGKIAEFRGQFDGVALMQQIGAIPVHS